jgi:hypothetical protein
MDGRSDTGTDNPIPLPNVSSKILAKVIEYCKYRVDVTKEDKPTISEEEKKQWDSDFVKVDQATLFELILVRVYDVTCALLSSRSVCFPVFCSGLAILLVLFRPYDLVREVVPRLINCCTAGCELPEH